jgi:polysaccharide export outer membrane protein
MIKFFKRFLVIATLFASMQSFATDSTTGTSQYKLRPLDVLTIKVFQEPDLDTVYKVSQNGMIVMPLINAVKVSGLTVQEAQQQIKALYEKDYLVKADVSIFISEYSPRRVYVIGQVNRPGEVMFPPEENMTLSKAIAGAMGTTRLANLRAINIKRTLPGGEVKVFEIDFRAILNKEGAKDFPVLDGDTIEVQEAMF